MGDEKQILSERLRQEVQECDSEEEEHDNPALNCDHLPFTHVSRDVTPKKARLRFRSGQKLGACKLKDKENSPKGKMSLSRGKSRFNSFELSVPSAPMEDTESTSRSLPTTPTREMEEDEGESEAPLTPTANLKVLLKVVSPDLKKIDLERQQQRLNSTLAFLNEQTQDSTDCDGEFFSSQESDCGKGTTSRKEKSLGLLCKKFLQMYPPYPDLTKATIEICLDEVAKALNVERRRIYDIVNVLESVEMVSRVAKNKYAWHGKTNLNHTLAKLKVLAEKEGFAEQIRNLRDSEMSKELSGPIQCHIHGSDADKKAFMRKDKSLGIMSQKFLMLFLVSKPKTVNLDMSAKILIGDADFDKTETAKYKTKIRRLYDIANILTSLELICKVHVTDLRGRKPAFKYIGPDINKITDVGNCCSEGSHRPSSRHSMLDCVKNETIAQIMTRFAPIRPAEGKTPFLPASVSQGSGPRADGRKLDIPLQPKIFPRHASFEQICQVAEKERSRLYGSNSEPSSPVKKLNFDDFPEDAPPKPLTIPRPFKAKIVQPPLKLPTSTATDPSKPHHLPIRFVQIPHTANLPKPVGISGAKVGTLIIQSQGSRTRDLTSDQLTAVLRSFQIPIPVSKTQGKLVDASTQSSPKSCSVPEDVAAEAAGQKPTSAKTTLADVYEQAAPLLKRAAENAVYLVDLKRMKMEFPTPPTTEEESVPSPCDSGLASEEGFEGKSRSLDLSGRSSPSRPMESELSPSLSELSNFSEMGSMPSPTVLLSLPGESSAKQLQPPHNARVYSLPKSFQIQAATNQFALQVGSSASVVYQLPLGLPSLSQENPPKGSIIVGYCSGSSDVSQASFVPRLSTSLNGTPFQVPVTFSPPLTPQNGQARTSTVFSFPNGVPKSLATTHVQIIQPKQASLTTLSTSTVVSSSLSSSSPSPLSLTSASVPNAQHLGAPSQVLLTPTSTTAALPSSMISPPSSGKLPAGSVVLVRQSKQMPLTPVSAVSTPISMLSPVTTGIFIPDTATPSQHVMSQLQSPESLVAVGTPRKLGVSTSASGASVATRNALRNTVTSRTCNTARKLTLSELQS